MNGDSMLNSVDLSKCYILILIQKFLINPNVYA